MGSRIPTADSPPSPENLVMAGNYLILVFHTLAAVFISLLTCTSFLVCVDLFTTNNGWQDAGVQPWYRCQAAHTYRSGSAPTTGMRTSFTRPSLPVARLKRKS